jgi:hypothetical protein
MKRLMTAVGMIVSLAVGTVAAGTMAASAPATDQVCPAGGGWFKYDGSWEPQQPSGITASIDGAQATITVADGFTLTAVCVKAGSAEQEEGPESWTSGLPLVGPGELTVWHSSGKDVSHISVMVEESQPEPEPEPEPEPKPEPPRVVALPLSETPREWNVWELERLARDRAGDDPIRDEEWSYLLVYLREFASPDGILPTDFDALVRESFGDLIADRAR